MTLNTRNSEVLDEMDAQVEKFYEKPTKAAPWSYQIVHYGVIIAIFLHFAALCGTYLCITSAKRATIFYNLLTYILTGIGVTAGAHRLWSHKSFKAKPILQVILMLFHSMSLQHTVIMWVMQHRYHHKYCDTDADPYNASRGFFFSHIGWILVKRHPEFKKRKNEIDISDVTSNPILNFQEKYAIPLIGGMCFLLPTMLPMMFWGETFSNAWHVNMLRFILNLHATFLINIAAHKYGNKPYNTQILTTQNLWVSLVICGEGFHNYHHSFPWDYRAAELGNNLLNLSTLFIDFCAYIGWAYDLKTTNKDLVRTRAKRTGDGTDYWGRKMLTE